MDHEPVTNKSGNSHALLRLHSQLHPAAMLAHWSGQVYLSLLICRYQNDQRSSQGKPPLGLLSLQVLDRPPRELSVL
jgi:hypothetical protein